MIRTKPELWEAIKAEVTRGTKGGVAGKWSARKAQLAVKIYKDRGGGYLGRKTNNSLTKWTKENWGYTSEGGRYLPESVRKRLTPAQRAGETRRKRGKEGQWVPYGGAVTKLMRSLNIS
jgi:hypothetical protein